MNERNPADPSLEAELSKPARAIEQMPERLRADILREARMQWPEPKPARSWIPIWSFAAAACACAIAILLLNPKAPSPAPSPELAQESTQTQTQTPEIVVSLPNLDVNNLLAAPAEALVQPYTDLYVGAGENLNELGRYLKGQVGFIGGLMVEADG